MSNRVGDKTKQSGGEGKGSRWALALVGLVLFGLGAFLIGKEQGLFEKHSALSEVGAASSRREAPRFKLPDSKKEIFTLERFKGRVSLVHFWASWCPPCLDEIPRWLELAQSYEGKPVHFIAISLDSTWTDVFKIMPETHPAFSRMRAGTPPQLLSLLDSEVSVPDQFGSYQYPETYLIDKNLRVITKWVGPQNWASAELRSLVEQAMQE